MKIRFWIPLCLYAGVIFYMSSLAKPLPEIDMPQFDKVLHLIEYSVFGFLAARAFRNSTNEMFIRNCAIIGIAITLLYGISDEIHQFFVPGRSFSIFDMLMDGIGGMIGVKLYVKYKPFQRDAV